MPKRRESRYENDYGYFPSSKPIKTTDGIQSKTKRGTFGASWWAKRWLQVLERFNIGARLQRGRSYARGGQVLTINITSGSVTARVQGSRPKPYNITIKLPALTDKEWGAAIEAMSQQAIFAAKLLAGEMPDDIEKAFEIAKIALFPTSMSQLQTDCSCPDYSNPCKHIAAVYYLIGEQFDTDPFLIFALRGRTKDQIMDSLRAMRISVAETSSSDSAPMIAESEATTPLIDLVNNFWLTGDLDALRNPVNAPTIPLPTLRRLGTSPADTHETMKTLYNAMTEYALQKVFGVDK